MPVLPVSAVLTRASTPARITPGNCPNVGGLTVQFSAWLDTPVYGSREGTVPRPPQDGRPTQSNGTNGYPVARVARVWRKAAATVPREGYPRLYARMQDRAACLFPVQSRSRANGYP